MRNLTLTLLACSVTLCVQAQQYPFQNPALTPDQRADDLLPRLTLEEKAALMQNNSPAIPRLGIKPYEWWNEALHGVGRNGLATVFPQAITMAATFDDDLVHDVFTAVSDEARAKYRYSREQGDYRRYTGLTFWTPNINIFRDPRWGRGQETYGEDPYLTTRMGLAVVSGLQGPAISAYDKTHACAKHYAVHSGPEWNRHSFNLEKVDPRDLWETYLPAFKALVQQGRVKEVMCAYQRFENEPCCGSSRLLTQILRNEWGFNGVVTSDCGAIDDFFKKGRHETHPDEASASSAAVLSGTDIECGRIYSSLPEAVKKGLIREEQIDISLRRLLKARFELGEMDASTPWDSIPFSVVDCEKHRQLNLKAALESVVLLQNNKNILPLKKGQTIALIGPNANDSVMQWGNYNGIPSHTVTLLEGLREALPENKLIYLPACPLTAETMFRSLFSECTNSKGNGFEAAYWNDAEQKGAPVAEVVQSTPFNFTTHGGTVFAPGVNLTGFSGVFRATFKPTVSGKVDFRTQMRGKLVITINGKEYCSELGHIASMKSVCQLEAEAGKTYDIEVKYYAVRPLQQGGFDVGPSEGVLRFDLGMYEPVDVKGTLAKLKKADVVLFAGGISPQVEGEEMPVKIEGFRGGDRTNIELPAVQRNFIAALKKAGKKIVYVNFSGSAIALVPEAQNCEAIVQSFYPGAQGGTALAKVLLGEYNPAGRLPVTFYKDTLQLADFQDYSMKGRTYRYMTEKPQFAFGHGLSYTSFVYGDAEISADKIVIPVTNTGKRDGEEVVQLYVKRTDDAEGPVKALRGFRRVNIAKGETVRVELPLNDETFSWWDKNTNNMQTLPGEFQIFYGGSSDEDSLKSLTINR